MTDRAAVTIVDLLGAILAGTPSLPGALCRGEATLFDGADEQSTAEALEICGWCPELGRCRAWLHAQQRHDAVTGVIAGEVRQYSPLGNGRPA